MSPASTYARMLASLLALDLALAATSNGAWFTLVELRELSGAIVIASSMYALRLLLWLLLLWRLLLPLRRTQQPEADDQQLLAGARAGERAPTSFAAGYAVSWLLHFAGATALASGAHPGAIALGHAERIATIFSSVAVASASLLLSYCLLRYLLEAPLMRIDAELRVRGRQRERSPSPLASPLLLLAVAFTIGPITWQCATTLVAEAHAARQRAKIETRAAAESSARALAAGVVELVDRQHDQLTGAELPAELRGALDGRPALLGEHTSAIDLRANTVTVASAVGDGRWVLARAEIAEPSIPWFALLAFSCVALLSVSLSVGVMLRSLITPITHLDAALRRVVEVGDLRALGRVPIPRSDELASLAINFNAMLDTFEHLADAAHAVSQGDLTVEVRGEGDLQDAFRRMIDDLHHLVVQLRDLAIEVASGSAEIQAAMRGQERAALQHAEGVSEASVKIHNLAELAEHISGAVDNVLDDAELSRRHADEVGTKIAALNEHVARVGELLDSIREVADRSDLLALNGSLEATRAGEAGRGFALVALEMRRLAERVTATVAAARSLMADIDAANAATVEATRHSRDLAEGTVNAANDINQVTTQQSVESQQVYAHVDELAKIVTQTAAATTQSRAVIDGLRGQAEQLALMIDRFELRANLRSR